MVELLKVVNAKVPEVLHGAATRGRAEEGSLTRHHEAGHTVNTLTRLIQGGVIAGFLVLSSGCVVAPDGEHDRWAREHQQDRWAREHESDRDRHEGDHDRRDHDSRRCEDREDRDEHCRDR